MIQKRERSISGLNSIFRESESESGTHWRMNDLEKFGAFKKGRELFDLVVDDMTTLQKIPMCWRLAGQQVASADSICANIEEGWGRQSSLEYRNFLSFARGSAQETRGRYARMHHWLPMDQINARMAICDEIIGILTASMRRLSEKRRTL